MAGRPPLPCVAGDPQCMPSARCWACKAKARAGRRSYNARPEVREKAPDYRAAHLDRVAADYTSLIERERNRDVIRTYGTD